jgi:outer membrane protein TolC
MKLLLVLICFINFSLTVDAQTDSLQYYLELSAKYNPSVLQKLAEYQAAVQKVPQVGGLPDPELSAGVLLSPMELLGGKQVADIRLMQMFPWFGVLKYARDEMSLMAMAKFEIFRDAKLQLILDVQRTWYDLHKVKQNIKVMEKNVSLLQTIERLAVVGFKAAPSGNNAPATVSSTPSNMPNYSTSGGSGMQGMGAGPGNSGKSTAPPGMSGTQMGASTANYGLSDVYRIQLELGALQNNIEQLKSQWNSTSALFNSYLNRPQYIPVTLPDTLVSEQFDPYAPPIADSVLKNNPMLEMLKLEQRSLEARSQMVTKMGYPMVGIGFNYSLLKKNEMSTSPMNGKDMLMPMVTATIPIYRRKYKAMLAEADCLRSANSLNYQATANSLQTEYYQALQLFMNAQRNIKLYERQYQIASKSMDIMLKGFATSTVALTDILRIHQQILEYEYKKIEAIAENNTAVAWLKRLANFGIEVEKSRNK